MPSELTAEPVTFLTVNAAVAETRDEATALMLPNLHMMARLRTGQPLGPVELVEDIRGADLTPQQQHIVDSGLERAVVGSPAEAAEQVNALAQRFGVDEVMVHPGRVGAPRHRSRRPRPRARRRWSYWPKSCSKRGVERPRPESAVTSSPDTPRSGCCCSC